MASLEVAGAAEGGENAEESVESWKSEISPSLSAVQSSIPSTVRLVAVSKTKPAEALLAAYEAGQSYFGENYVQELCEKSQHPLLRNLDDLHYHFIGRLQSNKASVLVKTVRQLECVETVETIKLASKLNRAVSEAITEGKRDSVLKIMIQVNSSGEPQKGGVESHEDAAALAKFISTECPNLRLTGMMTIGRADYTAGPENFKYLAESRSAVAVSLGIEESAMELSMGMSNDYLTAIEHGSTNIRVGSTIFGRRSYS